MKIKIIYTLAVLFCFTALNGQQVQKSDGGIFLLKGGELETVLEGRIKADVLIDNGVIKEVNDQIQHPGATLVDCKGLIIYPGMIDSGTKLGLAEVGAVSLTQDHNEIGEFTPHMQALTAINPNSVSIPVTRVNGITTSLAVPSGGQFPGTAALIDLHGYTPNQMYAGFKAVVFNYPSTGKRGRWDRRSEEDIKKDSEKAQKKLKSFWENVQLRAKIVANAQSKNQKVDFSPQLDALVPVANGDAQLLVEVNKEEDILAAISWINKNNIKAVLTGAAEGYRVADTIAKYNIPVITGPILNNPSRDSDHYNVGYANAGLMQKAGVKVAIRTNETENVRNLPYNAGFAATYGMGWREAFKAVTIVPAQIFGIDDKYGTVEKDKVANIFIADGDPFETKTTIKHLFIKGWKVPLESRHTLLYDEFLERDPGLEEK